MIEIRYAGVVVGRSSIVRELDTRGLFLGMAEPLPVGTAVELEIDEHLVPGRVEWVAETPDLARAGMRVRFAQPDDASLFGNPLEAPPEAAPPRAFEAPASVATARASHDATAVVSIDHGVPAAAAASAAPNGPRPIGVEASAEKPAELEADEPFTPPGDASDAEGAAADGSAEARLPAPDPAALGNSGGSRKNRRNRRR